MAAQKPSIPAGTRDFSPAEMIRRNYIFDTIRRVFQQCGFQPLETPATENLSTLLGKYGEEGDKLLFKILNSGDFLSKVSPEEISGNDSNKLSAKICERGLRYDLTVPFARYVVQHQGEISFPFRRYQIQPVWRADRPQKGRYREFYQCDVDVIGSRSLLNEVELVGIVERVFKALGISVTLKLNNRKILYGIAETIGHADRMTEITAAIDKLEKIGLDKVNDELCERGISGEAIGKLQPILALAGSNREKLSKLSSVISTSGTGSKGIGEMTAILDYVEKLGIALPLEIDLSLARGLNYYTGAIFEVKANDFAIGSICGGGRYDDLTGIFGLSDTSGVGISFGADRIYDVMVGLDLFPAETMQSTKVFFVNFGGEAELAALQLISRLRDRGISAEIYPEAARMKKQMEYANRRVIPYTALIGDDELTARQVTLKDMTSGEQTRVPFADFPEKFS
ncbi:MAG: histidine--tRNA ligase [Rikenellaceae bacterium]|jgi:histidyl-tRNA synthetase|nr:histidine--tRNA ligase [Rikenellaceae bacterium]